MKRLACILIILLAVLVSSCSKKNTSLVMIPEMESIETVIRADTVPADTLRPFQSVEQMPLFPGGDAEMLRFVSNNLRINNIPDSLITENLTTVVRFVVSKTGEIKDVEPLERHKGTILSDSLASIVKRMPRWIPGRQNGIPVDVYFTIPLRVSLK